jgi:hypothetical protein
MKSDRAWGLQEFLEEFRAGHDLLPFGLRRKLVDEHNDIPYFLYGHESGLVKTLSTALGLR